MSVKYQGTHGMWIRWAGVWVFIDPTHANSMLWDMLGGHNTAWQLYRITNFNPIGPVTTWLKFMTTDKNGPGSLTVSSANLGASQFSGLPDLRKTQLTWTEPGAGGGFDLEIFFQNFNDSSFNFTSTLGAGRNGATGILCNPAGHAGNAVQAHLTYVDADGFKGPQFDSNSLTL